MHKCKKKQKILRWSYLQIVNGKRKTSNICYASFDWTCRSAEELFTHWVSVNTLKALSNTLIAHYKRWLSIMLFMHDISKDFSLEYAKAASNEMTKQHITKSCKWGNSMLRIWHQKVKKKRIRALICCSLKRKTAYEIIVS